MQNDSVPSYSIYPTIKNKDNTNTRPVPQETVTSNKPLLGPENTVTECPFCYASVKTAVKYTTTTRTHIAAALCCLVCCMCCIPYGSDSAKNTDHYCPNCQKYLGTYEK